MDVEKGIITKPPASIKRLLEEEKKSHKDDENPLSPCISRIPPAIFSLIPPSPHRLYIHIGPLQSEHRPITDKVKARYMYDLFQRLNSPQDEIVDECMKRVNANIERIKAYYDHNVPGFPVENFEVDSLTHIIVLDACYILELLYKWSENKKSTGNLLEVKYDLVRLDNQIPFFALQDIFECTLFRLRPRAFLPNLILAFLQEIIIPFEPNNVVIIPDTNSTDYKHILDLLYQCCIKPTVELPSNRFSRVTTMLSATELAKAGVKFIPNPNPNQDDMKWNLKMKFRSSWGNATLTMPTMHIEEPIAQVLCNLAAYERVFPEVGNYITSYVFAMKMLLDTKEDVLKLVESKICRNPTGHQYIVDLIHGLCKDAILTDFLYAKEWQKMGKYCNSRLGWTRRTYFSGAWSYIASISGLILFILTVIQTYCSIRNL